MNYLIYARKSTDEEEKQVLSIEAQITELREFATKENLKVIEEYIESKTAKKPGRSVFNAMMERIEKSGPLGILSWHPDRLARNSVDGGKIIYLIDTEKLASLKFPTFWFEPTPQGKFMLNIAFGQSKYYIDNLSENVKRGIRQKLRRGEWPGLAPVGYLNELRNHTIIKDPERWQKVKKLFEAYATGEYTLDRLQELSLSLGLVSRRTGKAIVLSKMTDILTNPFYYGVIKHKREYYQGSHEPIITKRLFDEVQKVHATKRNNRPNKDLIPIAFRRLFKCGECGRMITAEKKQKLSGLKYTYYRCTKKNVVCSQKFLEERKLITQIDEIIKSVALPDDLTDYMINRVNKEIKESKTKFEAEKKILDDEFSKLKDRQEKLLEAYLDRTISHEEFTAAKQKILNRQIEIKEFLSSFRRKGDARLELFKKWILDAHQAPSKAYSNDLSAKRNFLEKIGSNFQVFGQKALISLTNQWLFAANKSQFSDWSG